jgi:outer membrane protein TolC
MMRYLLTLLLLTLTNMAAAQSMKLTLSEAVRLALAQNRVLKIARLKIVEVEQKKAAAKSSYFPEIKNHSMAGHSTAEGNIEIPAGAFGALPNVGPVPNRDILINQGNTTFVTSGTTAVQPLTPLIRIRQANRIAASAVAVSRNELRKAENEVALKVHEVYYGLLVARLQKQAAEQDRAYSRTRLSESQEEVRNGNALKVAIIETEASLLQSEQNVLTIDLRIADLNTELNDLLGLPLDTNLALSPVAPVTLESLPRKDAMRLAVAENPQIAAAMESVKQARAALTAAKSAYIPDVSVFAKHSYQNGAPFLVHNFGTFGVNLSYDVVDFGRRRAVVREREAQLEQAEQNVDRLKEAVSVQVERSLNKVERTKQMLQVAAQVVKLRAEGDRIAGNQLANGVVLVSARRQASAATYKARADLLQAELSHLLANAELEETIGQAPGQ